MSVVFVSSRYRPLVAVFTLVFVVLHGIGSEPGLVHLGQVPHFALRSGPTGLGRLAAPTERSSPRSCNHIHSLPVRLNVDDDITSLCPRLILSHSLFLRSCSSAYSARPIGPVSSIDRRTGSSAGLCLLPPASEQSFTRHVSTSLDTVYVFVPVRSCLSLCLSAVIAPDLFVFSLCGGFRGFVSLRLDFAASARFNSFRK